MEAPGQLPSLPSPKSGTESICLGRGGGGGTHSTNLNGFADLHTDASSTSTLSM